MQPKGNLNSSRPHKCTAKTQIAPTINVLLKGHKSTSHMLEWVTHNESHCNRS